MERTNEEPYIIESFGGINQLIDELELRGKDEKGLTPWMHGLYATERENVKRLPGKHLNSSVTTGGHVLTLYQMEFVDRNVLLIHQSSAYLIEDDLTELQSSVDVTPLLPTEPFIF